MELGFTGEDLAFQEGVRDFVRSSLPDDIREKTLKGQSLRPEDQVRWSKILHEKGWIAPAWPEEYGGTNWSATQHYIFNNELSLAGAPDLSPFGLSMVGPVIYTFGTPEQKEQHLPQILKSDIVWCQGYSEPGSGSDLASLKMSAISDGDDYICNGTKVWTTEAHLADWIFCLVRTDGSGKKQEGISFLLMDMRTPGIEVSPIISIDGGHSVNQVFFTDVRVPKSNLIGEEGKGWTYAKFLLVNERNTIVKVGSKKRMLGKIIKLAGLVEMGGGPLADTPSYRHKIAEAEVALMALEYSELRYLSGQKADHAAGAEASMMKVRATVLQQSMSELFVEIAGYYGLPYDAFRDQFGSNEPPVGLDDFAGGMAGHLYGRAATIYGGSNEIQKDVISKLMVGL